MNKKIVSIKNLLNITYPRQICFMSQRPARFSFLENSRKKNFIFTSRSRSRAVSISLSLLEKEWRDFIFHFSLLEKSESYPYFTLFSREKRVKSGAGYNLTSIFVTNCISKDCISDNTGYFNENPMVLERVEKSHSRFNQWKGLIELSFLMGARTESISSWIGR